MNGRGRGGFSSRRRSTGVKAGSLKGDTLYPRFVRTHADAGRTSPWLQGNENDANVNNDWKKKQKKNTHPAAPTRESKIKARPLPVDAHLSPRGAFDGHDVRVFPAAGRGFVRKDAEIRRSRRRRHVPSLRLRFEETAE